MSAEQKNLTAAALADLRAALEENAEFYHVAAINSAHDAIATFLRRRAQERARFAQRLDDLDSTPGAATSKPGVSGGSDEGLQAGLRQGLLTLTAGMTIAPTNVDKRVLQEAQDADARLLEQYESILGEENLNATAREEVAAQAETIEAAYAYGGTQLSRRFDSVVLGLFAQEDDVHAAVHTLQGMGLADEQIALVASEAMVEKLLGDRKAELTSATSGVAALGGTVLGGLIGFLAGMGTIMIPGIGPALAVSATATVLGSTALGAGVGASQASFLGMLVGLGVAEEDTQRYTTGVSQGELLLVVHAATDATARVAEVMRTNHGTDVDVRVAPEPTAADAS
ncbi:MAG: hypothetical protein KDE20_23970 [Caldilineaceae bacterium]|nr:hypothetical protein [Caldilineaceae bacterium]